MDTPINVDKDNQWKHNSEFVKIIRNMYDTCFISYFSRVIDWEWSQVCHSPPSHAHRRRKCQPGRVPQMNNIIKNTHGKYFISNISSHAHWRWQRQPCLSQLVHQKHTWHMFDIQFFKRNWLGSIAHRCRECQRGWVPQVGASYFQKHIAHISYPIFLVILNDIDTINEYDL